MENIKKVDRQWLKDYRNERRLTVRETAEKLGISFSYYSDLENGRRNPSVEKAVIISDFFNFDVNLLLMNRVRFSEKIH